MFLAREQHVQRPGVFKKLKWVHLCFLIPQTSFLRTLIFLCRKTVKILYIELYYRGSYVI